MNSFKAFKLLVIAYCVIQTCILTYEFVKYLTTEDYDRSAIVMIALMIMLSGVSAIVSARWYVKEEGNPFKW